MSRNYATFATSIWRPEGNFTGLSRDGQWAYFVLSTQPDISAAGVLSLNVKRWASRARNTSREDVITALQELQAAGKVVYDTDTEELLIPTFVDDDGGYNNRKRRPVIERAARDVESPRLRRALGRELAKLNLPLAWVGLSEEDLAGDEEPGERATGDADPASRPTSPQQPSESAFSQVDSLYRFSDIGETENTDTPCRSDGVVVTQAVVVRPQPSTHIPQSVPPPAVPADADTPDGLFDQPSSPGVVEATPTPMQRAFGLARWWIKLRDEQNTPVIVAGRNGPLHGLKNLIEPFAKQYADDEIKTAFEQLDKGFPAKTALDDALTRIRRGVVQGHRGGGYQPSYPSRGVAVRDEQPRMSAGERKWRQANELAEQLDREFAANGGVL